MKIFAEFTDREGREIAAGPCLIRVRYDGFLEWVDVEFPVEGEPFEPGETYRALYRDGFRAPILGEFLATSYCQLPGIGHAAVLTHSGSSESLV